MRTRLFVLATLALALVAPLKLAAAAGADSGDAPSPTTLVGRLLLPAGTGSRGVEIIATTIADGASARTWLLFDAAGRFTHEFRGRLVSLAVVTGLQAELAHFDAPGLPPLDAAGRLDLGAIDLRDRLVGHRMTVRAASGAPAGEVKIALCFGPPPTGPQGEMVSLGSRQFPAHRLGEAIDWLLPPDAVEVHFLVERPADAGRGPSWRTGAQTVFGPYAAGDLPEGLVVD